MDWATSADVCLEARPCLKQGIAIEIAGDSGMVSKTYSAADRTGWEETVRVAVVGDV